MTEHQDRELHDVIRTLGQIATDTSRDRMEVSTTSEAGGESMYAVVDVFTLDVYCVVG